MVILAVPINVDESIQYHPIACSAYENAKYHTFWNACDGSTYLSFVGIHVPRAYGYIGALSSYLYWPFFKLYPSILTQRVLGVCFLIGFLSLVSALEREARFSVLVIFGLSFPLVYQLIADTGPVRFGLTMMAFTPWSAKLILRTTYRAVRALLNVVLAVLLFLAVEDKPFFLYLIPSVAALTLAYTCDRNGTVLEDIRHLLRRTWMCIAVFCGLLLMYFFGAHTSSGDSYIVTLVQSVKPTPVSSVFINIVSYMTNLSKFANMVYEARQFRLPNVTLSLMIWTWGSVFIARALMTAPVIRRKLLLTMAAFTLSILSMLVTRNAWAGHHFIYCFVLALLVVCQAMSCIEKNRALFIAAYAFVGVALATELPYLQPSLTSSWGRYRVFDYLKRSDVATNYVIAHLSLGTYYVASLYGNETQLSVQIDRLDVSTATQLMSLSERLQRKILCVCRGAGCDADVLSRQFLGRVLFKEAVLSDGDWRVYLETSRSFEAGDFSVQALGDRPSLRQR